MEGDEPLHPSSTGGFTMDLEKCPGVSDAQRAQRIRAWNIHRLRGMHANATQLCCLDVITPEEALAVHKVVESALLRLKAETMSEQRQRLMREAGL